MKRSIRLSMASLMVSGVVAAGFALVSTAPAGADTAPTTLSCDITTKPGKITCSAGDLDGIKSIAIYNADVRANAATIGNDCTTPVLTQTLVLTTADRYKITINDCSKPKQKSAFIVKGDGSVTPVGEPPTT